MSLADSVSSCALLKLDASLTFTTGGSSLSTTTIKDVDTDASANRSSPTTQKRRLKGCRKPGSTSSKGGSMKPTLVSRPAFDSSPAVDQVWSTFTAMNVMHAPSSRISSRAKSSAELPPLHSKPFDCSPSAGSRPAPRPARASLPKEAKGGLNKTFASAGELCLPSDFKYEDPGLSKILEASQSVQDVLSDLCCTLRSDWGSQSVKKRQSLAHMRQSVAQASAVASESGGASMSRTTILPQDAPRKSMHHRSHKMLGLNVNYQGSQDVQRRELTDERLRDLKQRPPLTAIRMCMCHCAGNWQEAFKILDSNGNGDVSLLEFEAGLDALQVPWKQITGFHNIMDVWKLFDADKNGALDITELLGVSLEDEEANAWNLQNTREKWFNWCERTHRKAHLGRNPCWAVDEVKQIEAYRNEEAEHMHEKTRMKCMMEKGIHRTNPRAVARFLPKVLTEETVSRQRREELDVVFRRSKKIRKVLHDISFRRKEMNSCVQQIKDLTNQSDVVKKKTAKKKDSLHRQESAANMLGQTWGKPQNADELSHFFDEESLGLEESDIHLRHIARGLGIPIPDAEAIKKYFDHVDIDGSGEVDKDEFRIMLHQIFDTPNEDGTTQKGELSDARVNEYWLSVDHDQSGTVEFEEFLQWYYEAFGAPSLTKTVHMSQAEHKKPMMI